MLVRLIYPKKWMTTFRQIPDFKDRIEDVVFTTEEVEEADLAVIVNFSPCDIKMKAREVWIFHQEPADKGKFGHWRKTYKACDRGFGPWQDVSERECKNFSQTQGSVLWGVSGEYNDYLASFDGMKKVNLSCITSAKKDLKGHKERLKFLYALQERLKGSECSFDIKGRGIEDIRSKDDVLIPSKYALCVENSIQKDYITEKLFDAFLCDTMPIYIGALNIFDYFPKNSLIYLEDYNVEKAEIIIKNAIETGMYEKTFKERQSAKELVLNRYNFFYNIVHRVKEFEIEKYDKKEIFVKKNTQMKHPLISGMKALLRNS